MMTTHLFRIYLKARAYLEDLTGELDEKALLIVFFVLIALAGLSNLGEAVSNTFKSVASSL